MPDQDPNEFIRVRHPDVEVEARMARRAVKHMPGWEPVVVDAPTDTAPTADTTAAAPAAAPVTLTKES